MRRPREFDHSSCAPACVAALNRIIAETGAKIVVSSVWRIGRMCADLREILNLRFGVVGDVIDRTPRLTVKKTFEGIKGQIDMSAERGDEIAEWMRTYQRHPIESFVILDDDADMTHLMDRLVQTQFEVGLTEADADRAIAMLNAKVEVTK